MFDPRTDIVGLFTSARIGADSRYSGTSVYVKILKEEIDNTDTEANDYGSKYVGILWLSPPREYISPKSINSTKYEHEAVVDCRLIVPRNDKWLRNNHETFIHNVLHTFETRIRDNYNASGKSWDIALPTNMPVTNNPDNPNVCYRVLELVCYKIN